MATVDWDQGEYESSTKVGGSGPVIPKGRYLAVILDSEDKETKAKTGRYFEFKFEVIKPVAHKGAKLYHRFNVYNPSEVAQRIGREQFNGMCLCVGLAKVKKTEQMHGKKVVLLVDVVTRDNGAEANEVIGFEQYAAPAGEAATPAAPPARPAARPAPPPPARPAARPSAPADVDDDDIPF